MKKTNRRENHFSKKQAGFTFVELIVVFGIISVLFAIGYISIANIQRTTTSNASISVIVSDIKAQQIKAMAGDTEGTGSPDTYGVKILPDSYVLFRGATYSASTTSNFSIPAPSGHTFSSTFPSTTIIFSQGTGEIAGFTSGQNTITLTHTGSGRVQTLEFNKYGTVTNVN